MNLRTKLIVNICTFMLLVCGLLTVNIVIDAIWRAKEEERQRGELLAQLVSDWVRGTEELQTGEPNWLAVQKRLTESALVKSWIIVSKRTDGLLEVETPPDAVPGADEKRLRDVLESRRITVDVDRVFAPVGGTNAVYAARFDLKAPLAVGIPAVGGIGGLVAVMVIGTALLVLNAYIFLNRFVLRPLDTLVEASHRVSEGDFSKKIPEHPTYDEMATLVNAFNLMLDKIGRHQQSLIEDVSKARQRVAHTEKRLFAAQRLSTTGTLAAGIAHEINNPLGGMINAARTIKSGTLPPDKQKEYLELIVDGLERVRTIVQKVLQFRPKALEPQPVGLRETITKAVAFMDHRARHKGIEIKNELPEDLPQVHGDPLELQQAFLNILMNAVDACIANSGLVRVTHKLEDAWVSTLIADNGCGMDEQELAHCMDLFYTTKDVGEGTGLGLAVAQNIVHNHGGKIEIQSEKGKGTTVSVRLPLLRSATQRIPAAEKAV